MAKIGNLELKSRIFLSPMLEPNDIAFRLLCKKEGAALTFTGMVNALSKQKLYLDDKPALQLFGNTPKGIKEFIKKYDDKVSMWDFNLGCPSKLSKKLAHGAFMHKDFKNIEEILSTIRKATKKPIAIKLRKSPQALEIAKLAEKYCDAIGIHARTAEQGYSGEPDYQFALELKSKSKIPIIYSGDPKKIQIKKILKDFDFVFIGRDAIGNPGIFAEIQGKKPKTSFKDYLRLSKKYEIFFRQIKFQAMHFTKKSKRAKEKRKKLINAKTIEEMEKAMKTNK